MQNKVFSTIDDLIKDCPEFFESSYQANDTSLVITGENLFSEYRESINLTVGVEAEKIHQSVVELRQTNNSFIAMKKIVDDVSTLLLANTSTFNISRTLGLSHQYVKKIKRLLDKRLEYECNNLDIPKKIYTLSKVSDEILNIYVKSLKKVTKNQNNSNSNRADKDLSITDIKKLRILGDGVNNTLRNHNNLLTTLDKVRPKDDSNKTVAEKRAEDLQGLLIDLVEDVVYTKNE